MLREGTSACRVLSDMIGNGLISSKSSFEEGMQGLGQGIDSNLSSLHLLIYFFLILQI